MVKVGKATVATEEEADRTRAAVAHALVLAVRQAKQAGYPDPLTAPMVRGILAELDALWERAPWEGPP